ncbi:MAG: hypothetical protein JWO94_723 [Verrucomicrobiaceae bacterium]|nr:hypothetical protein [Verrucomicrobiaceae bacterium]
MNVGKYYVALVLLLAALAGLIWKRSHQVPEGEVAAQRVVLPDGTSTVEAAPQNGEIRWVNESHWMVDVITRDLAQMTAFAAKGGSLDPATVQSTVVPQGSEGDSFRLAVKGPAGKTGMEMKLRHHFWAPENYTPFAAALLKEAGLKGAAPSATESTLPSTLTSPETTTLVRESKRISEELTTHPLDAALHDEAALVIGSLAFREAAGRFSDLRPALGRMTAHLALARALQSTPTSCGLLAEAIQLSLVKRQAEALERADKLPPALSAWAMALRLRNTRDWRLLPKPEAATLLEQIAFAQAVVSSLDPTALSKFLETAKPKAMPDWARLALSVEISVQEGHMFATPSVQQEVTEADMVRRAFAGDRVTRENLGAMLSESAGLAVTRDEGKPARLEVLGWGTLASFHQRHLLHAVDRTHYFFGQRWGVPDEDAALLASTASRLGGLKLYPLLAGCGACDSTGLEEARNRAAELCEKHPEAVTASIWAALADPKEHPELGGRPPPPYQWFGSAMPMGTAFDFNARDCELHCLTVASFEDLTKTAPYDFNILYTAAERQGVSGYEGLAAAFKSIADYHVFAQHYIAKQLENDPAAYIKAMEKVAVLDPDEYLTLGSRLAAGGQADEAARAFENAFQKANDRVRMANQCGWLIDYYMDHNRKEEALKVAADAAEVYSYRGLETAGRLMARLEKWDEAGKLFQAIAERYNDPGPLIRFLAEHKDAADVKAGYDAMISNVFKGEPKAVTMADFKEAPSTGTSITTDSQLAQQYNIKRGDVIVAIDGYRADSFEQYRVLRALKADDVPLQLIYWDGGAYRELTAAVPKRRLGCDMDTYHQ